MAALSVNILKFAGGRVSSPFAVPADAGLRRQVGEAVWLGGVEPLQHMKRE